LSALTVSKKPRQKTLFDDLEPEEEPAVVLPTMLPEEEVYTDYRTTGLSLRSHPMAFQRERLKRLGVIQTEQLAQVPNDTSVKVAGIVLSLPILDR